jgi:hypothetical protein
VELHRAFLDAAADARAAEAVRDAELTEANARTWLAAEQRRGEAERAWLDSQPRPARAVGKRRPVAGAEAAASWRRR